MRPTKQRSSQARTRRGKRKARRQDEVCNFCARSVAMGSGRFVNRVPMLDPEPSQSGWLCAECEDQIDTTGTCPQCQ